MNESQTEETVFKDFSRMCLLIKDYGFNISPYFCG